tara:strand:- start:18889 stop:19605 length:717 start_codon:yes stop_codon:yes gene_type:complete
MCETDPTWVSADMLTAYSIESQLGKEIGDGHPLDGVPFTVLATCSACDDALIEITKTGQRMGVHPTWGELQEPPFPASWMVGDPWLALKVDDAIIRVDVDSTKLAHDKPFPHPYAGCSCENCENLGAQQEVFPSSDVRRWFRLLGINPSRPSEVVHLGPEQGGHLYWMIYHMRGRFDEDSVALDLYGFFTVTYQINDDSITITNKSGPPPGAGLEFHPILKVDLMVIAPWVLDCPEST